MKIIIYASNRKDKKMTLKVKTADDLKQVIALAKSEMFRLKMLKDIDYEDYSLIFKIDDKKYTAKEIAVDAQARLNRIDGDKEDEKPKKKKKKDKDSSGGKKKKKKGKKKSKGKGKSKDAIEVIDGRVKISRED